MAPISAYSLSPHSVSSERRLAADTAARLRVIAPRLEAADRRFVDETMSRIDPWHKITKAWRDHGVAFGTLAAGSLAATVSVAAGVASTALFGTIAAAVACFELNQQTFELDPCGPAEHDALAREARSLKRRRLTHAQSAAIPCELEPLRASAFAVSKAGDDFCIRMQLPDDRYRVGFTLDERDGVVHVTVGLLEVARGSAVHHDVHAQVRLSGLKKHPVVFCDVDGRQIATSP